MTLIVRGRGALAAGGSRPRCAHALLLAAAVASGCSASSCRTTRDDQPSTNTAGYRPARRSAARLANARAAPKRARIPGPCAVCYAHNWQDGGRRGYGSAASQQSLRELAALGIRAVSLTPFGWMASLDSPAVRWSRDHAAGESFSRLRRSAARAKALGMNVVLKPHIWVGHGAWRGEIAPDTERGGWQRWFASYTRFILDYARLAQATGVDWLVVGVELSSATRGHLAAWRELVRRVRRVYRGKLTYGANWDEVERIRFWDALDAVGVQMFAPLAEGEQPTQGELTAAANRWLARFSTVARSAHKPLLLTEAGFVNVATTLRRPYVWPEKLEDARRTSLGDRLQLMGYRALATTFGRSPLVRAIYWWKWFSDPETDEEGPVGYSPRGKPAAQLLGRLCGETGRGRSAPGHPDQNSSAEFGAPP